MRTVIYTAIFGGYDALHQPVAQNADQVGEVDFVCFTDQPPAAAPGLWRVIRSDARPDLHPRLRAKWFKTHPQAAFAWPGRLACLRNGAGWLGSYDHAIWIDGSLRIKHPDFARDMVANIGASGVAVFRHPDRDCIYQEAAVSLGWRKYDGLPLREQIESYRAEGFPPHHGLMAGGVIASRRGNRRLAAIFEAWWQENLRWSYQDQLSLPVVLWRHGLRNDWIDGHLWFNDWYDHVLHRFEEGPLPGLLKAS